MYAWPAASQPQFYPILIGPGTRRQLAYRRRWVILRRPLSRRRRSQAVPQALALFRT